MVEALTEALGEDLPAEVAALASLGEELKTLKAGGGLERVWLEKVQRDNERLERYFRQAGDLNLLAQVYVELDVDLERYHHANARAEDLVSLRQPPRELMEILKLTPGSVPWVTGRWALLGDPGAGKTTLLRYLAASLAAEDPPRWIPVYESLPRWMPEAQPLPQRVECRLRRAGHPYEGFATLCDQLARDGRLLVLLDGLDEVPREQRCEAEELLRDLAARWPHAQLVVASRPIGYRSPAASFTELRLLPLDRERRRELLARWLGRRRKNPGLGWRRPGPRRPRGGPLAVGALRQPALPHPDGDAARRGHDPGAQPRPPLQPDHRSLAGG